MADVVQSREGLSKRDLEETQIAHQHRRCIEHWNTFLGALPEEKVVLPSIPIWADEIDATYPYEDITPWAYMLGTGNGGRLQKWLGFHTRQLSSSAKLCPSPC